MNNRATNILLFVIVGILAVGLGFFIHFNMKDSSDTVSEPTATAPTDFYIENDPLLNRLNTAWEEFTPSERADFCFYHLDDLDGSREMLGSFLTDPNDIDRAMNFYTNACQ